MPTTVTLSDDLAKRLQPYQSQLSEIVELGLRELQAQTEGGYNGANSVLEQLAYLPTPEEVLALRPSPQLQSKIDALLEKNRTTGLTAEDQREWDQCVYLEHLVRIAKASAIRKIQQGMGACAPAN